jgi:hypothetical protein
VFWQILLAWSRLKLPHRRSRSSIQAGLEIHSTLVSLALGWLAGLTLTVSKRGRQALARPCDIKEQSRLALDQVFDAEACDSSSRSRPFALGKPLVSNQFAPDGLFGQLADSEI